MFGLVVGFSIQMCKLAANAQEGTTPGLEILTDKLSRPSKSDKEVQAASTVIVVASLERVLEDMSTVGGAAQDASRNLYAALEDEVPTEEFPRVDDVPIEASFIEVTNEPPPRARRARFAVDGARRPPDRLVLSSYVERME